MWSKTGKSLLYTGASRVREKLIIYTTATVLDRARRAPDNAFTGFLEHDKY
jgi:ATP-dependent exoDNAse (exonuclease V) alpha subunit